MEEEQKEQLQPWHRKALIAGRKPLPDTAGVRPWIPCIRMETEEEKNARERQEKVLKRRLDLARRKANFQHKQWSKAELKRLGRLRHKNMPWKEMKSYFPHRTLDGMKQAWHKHRPDAWKRDDQHKIRRDLRRNDEKAKQ